MKLSICIVTYNSESTIVQCLESLLKYCGRDVSDVWILDNNSTDRTYEVLQRVKPLKEWPFSLNVLKSESNIGFAAGCNVIWPSTKGDIVLFLNPDCIVESSFEQLLHLYESEKQIGIAGAKTYTILPTGDRVVAPPGFFPSYLRQITGTSRFVRKWSPDLTTDVEYVGGATLSIRRACLEEVSGFDETFLLYLDDDDLCKRVALKGHRIVYTPVFQASHYYHVSIGRSIRENKEVVLGTRAAVEFLVRHDSKLKAYAYLYVVVLKKVVSLVLSAKRKKQDGRRSSRLRLIRELCSIKPGEQWLMRDEQLSWLFA